LPQVKKAKNTHGLKFTVAFQNTGVGKGGAIVCREKREVNCTYAFLSPHLEYAGMGLELNIMCLNK